MSKTRLYVEDKNIEILFEEMMRHVINKKPQNPVKFLISLLQDKGESLAEKKHQPVKTTDGPVRSKTAPKKNLDCEGCAIDIRKSMERVLPKSANPKPLVKDPVEEQKPVPMPESIKIPSPKPVSTAVSAVSLCAPVGSNNDVDQEKDDVTTAIDDVTAADDVVITTDDVVVTKEYVANVQSIFNFGRKKKKSSESVASGSTGKDNDSGDEKANKNDDKDDKEKRKDNDSKNVKSKKNKAGKKAKELKQEILSEDDKKKKSEKKEKTQDESKDEDSDSEKEKFITKETEGKSDEKDNEDDKAVDKTAKQKEKKKKSASKKSKVKEKKTCNDSGSEKIKSEEDIKSEDDVIAKKETKEGKEQKDDKSNEKIKAKKKEKKNNKDDELEKSSDQKTNEDDKKGSESKNDLRKDVGKDANEHNKDKEDIKEEAEDVGVSHHNNAAKVTEELDEDSVMVTASCDLTELLSWRDGEMDIESLQYVTEVEHSAVRDVHSAAPPTTHVTKQSEDLILKEEVFSTVKTAFGAHKAEHNRITSPCNTVFFDEPDEDPPLVQELVAVFKVPQQLLDEVEPVLRKESDAMSISDLCGSPWTYAESIS